jgi:serine/threonine protein kinase
MAIQTGTRIGEYEVQECVGRGAMGIVYRAFHRGINRPVAVKMLHVVGADPAAVSSFRREALATAQMRHPNILQLYDFGEVDGTPYMIVEFVPGGSLADRLRAWDPIPDPAVSLSLLTGIASALDYAHQRGVVHRDVKPANVLMDVNGNPILADFGIAKILQSGSLTTLGVTKGTPSYMAPEQVAGEAIGPAADRYALAILAYRMLCGRLPFESESVLDVIYAQVNQPPPPPSSFNPKLGPAVDAVLLRGLAKHPQERWRTCWEMVSALQQALDRPAHRWKTWLIPFRRSRGRRVPIRHSVLAGALSGLMLGVGGWIALLPSPPAVGLSTQTVQPGQSLQVSATNLPARHPVTIVLDDSPLELTTGSVLKTRRVLKIADVDGDGRLSTSVYVVPTVNPGRYWLRMCWNETCPASSELLVTGPQESPSPAGEISASR